MNWFWLNIPLGVVMTLIAAGLPMWVLLKHPEEGVRTKRAEVAAHAARSRANERRPFGVRRIDFVASDPE
jgi:hypothetical protein